MKLEIGQITNVHIFSSPSIRSSIKVFLLRIDFTFFLIGENIPFSFCSNDKLREVYFFSNSFKIHCLTWRKLKPRLICICFLSTHIFQWLICICFLSTHIFQWLICICFLSTHIFQWLICICFLSTHIFQWLICICFLSTHIFQRLICICFLSTHFFQWLICIRVCFDISIERV